MVDKFQRGSDHNKRIIYNLYLENIFFVNSWDLVDVSAHKIIGPYLYKRSREKLFTMAHSTSLWQRRIAIMSTFHFIRHYEYRDTLAIAQILLEDKEDLIHKAVGWMLRELGKRDLETEEAFLVQHYSKMPRTMLRYAIEKFPATKRKRYLAGLK